MQAEQLRPDSKGRISLGKYAKGVSSFRITVDENHRIILEPFAEVPLYEKWLYDNPQALTSVRKGMEQSAKGETKSLGSFSKHLDK